MLVPGDLGKVKVFAGLKYQRLESRVVPDPVGHRLVNGKPVLAVQLVEVTGENAHARRVSKTILHSRIVQPAEDLEVLELIRQLGQQRWRRFVKCAGRLRDQLGLIKAEVIYDGEQAARRIRRGHLPQTFHPGQQ